MFNLYVAGRKLDTYENTDNIVINANLIDLSSPERRGILFSNKIKLPKTANNVSILNILSDDVFQQTLDVSVYFKTIQILKADINILSIKNEISVQIVDKFSKLINNLKISFLELDLDSYDIIYNESSYSSLKNNTTGCLSWELMDGRNEIEEDINDGNDLDPNIAFFRPHYLVLENIEKIFEAQGYSVNTDGLDSTVSDLRMISNAKQFVVSFFQKTITSLSYTAGNKLALSSPDFSFTHAMWGEISSNQHVYDNGVFAAADPYAIPGIYYIIEIETETPCYFMVNIINTPLAPAQPTLDQKRYYVNGKQIIVTEPFEDSQYARRYIYFTLDSSVTVTRFRVNIVTTEKNYYTKINTDADYYEADITYSDWYVRQTAPPTYKHSLLYGLKIKPAFNFPFNKQYDLLKEIWKMFNLKFELIDDTVYITHNSLGTTPIEINDYILDRSEIDGFDDYAQSNIFKYADEAGQYIKAYDSKDITKTFIQLSSDRSTDRNISELATAFDLGYIAKYKLSDPANDSDDDVAEVNNLFFLSTDNDEPTEINADKKLTSDGLDWETLYNAYYAEYYDYLQGAKVIQYQVKIDYITFLKLLNSGKVYDKMIGRELTILKIEKFNPDRVTTLTAITREVDG